MKPIGKGKLSKRDGEKMGFPVFPLSWNESEGYREAGYFPETVINFLALLGWNAGTEQEIFSLSELIEAFTLERVHKSGARFDPEKNKWYNHQYLQTKDEVELALLFSPILKEKLKKTLGQGSEFERDELSKKTAEESVHLKKIISLVKERATFVSDFWELSNYFFIAPETYNPQAVKKQWKEDSADIMNRLAILLRKIKDFSSPNVEHEVKAWIVEQELSLGKVMPPLRLIIVGDMKGPHIFDILELIGKEESIRRIEKAVQTF